MREEGIVKSLHGENCIVAVTRKAACGENCANCAGCAESGVRACEVKNSAGAHVGDRVIIEVSSASILKSAFLVYILPILAFFAIFAAANICLDEYKSALCGAVGTLAVFAVLHKLDKRLGSKCISETVEIVEE